MSLYGTAVRKPVSTALVFVAIVIFGLFSLSRLSVDLLPEIETNTIMVMTAVSRRQCFGYRDECFEALGKRIE